MKTRRGDAETRDTAFFRPVAYSPHRHVLFLREFPMCLRRTKMDENMRNLWELRET